MHRPVERNGPRLLQTIEIEEHPSVTRAVLQTVRILLHGISAVLAKGVSRGGQRGRAPPQIFRKYSHFVL